MIYLLSSKKFQVGFTLIELLVAVAVISVVLGLTLVSFTTIQARSRDSTRKSDLTKIAAALEEYYADNGLYPQGNTVHASYADSLSYEAANPWIAGLDKYITTVPRDPKNTSSGSWYYYYQTWNNRQNYHIMVNLENNNDSDARILISSTVLQYSPCNEEPWKALWGSYKNRPPYDWCVSGPPTP